LDEEIETRGDGKVLLQASTRLSRSVLWDLQREFFRRQAVLAWSGQRVPHYITNNPVIAEAYARVVLGWLRDLANGNSPERRVHILELGAGSGRFAYRFLKILQPLLGPEAPGGLQIRYVMTDFVEGNLEFWRSHPAFQPFVESGRLDFALFQAESAGEIALRVSGETLAEGTGTPLIVLANYFFDSIPQDAFVVSEGQLHERLVSVKSPRADLEPGDPQLLDNVEVDFDHRPTEPDYYGDPDLDRILEEYRRSLPDTALLFPAAALQCLRHLAAISGNRLLLLSADKGYHREEDLLGRNEPAIAIHGSFSLSVNYHAIGRYVLHHGGQVLHPSHLPSSLVVSAFLLGTAGNGWTETRQAYDWAIDRWGPDDFFSFKERIEQSCDSLDVEQVLSFLRLSGWDDEILMATFPALSQGLEAASEGLRREVRRALAKVWDLYLPIGEERDVAFIVGTLLYQMGDYAEALLRFQRSFELHGPAAATWYNLGACHYGLRRMDLALSNVEAALAQDPAFEPARALRIVITSELEATG